MAFTPAEPLANSIEPGLILLVVRVSVDQACAVIQG
jgi:hypothetical protein